MNKPKMPQVTQHNRRYTIPYPAFLLVITTIAFATLFFIIDEYFHYEYHSIVVTAFVLTATTMLLSSFIYFRLRLKAVTENLSCQLAKNTHTRAAFDKDEISLLAEQIKDLKKQANSDDEQLRLKLTEMDKLSSQLQSQYSRLSAIINTVIDGVITIDKHGIVETFNPAAEKIFGYKASDVIGHNVKMLMPAPYQDEHDSYLTNYITTSEAKVIGIGREVLGQKASGQLFPMELSVSEMMVDGKKMFTGIVRDVSDITEQKSLLNDQVARIKAIIETVVDGIITINESGVVDSFNPAAEKIFGYTEREVIGNNIKMLMPAPYQEEHDDYLKNYLTSGIKKVIGSGREVLGKRKNGSVFPMSLAVSEMKVGNKIMFTGIVRDITERRKYETALDQYRDNLEQQVQDRTAELEAASLQAQSANRSKSKFLSRMSHELRTPLNAIIGFTQILEDEQLTPQQHDSLQEIATAGKNLMQMVNEILQVASVQTGDIAISSEEVNLNECVKNAFKLIENEAKTKGISVLLPHSPLLYVNADYSKLKQVFTNLIENAVQYSDAGSSVKIEMTEDDSFAVISVMDEGKGIPQDKVESIFSPFERGPDEYSGEHGIGIGLTIVKELIEAMNGSVSVTSQLGKGSTFNISIPLIRKVEDNQKGTNKILYIEDNSTNRKLMNRLISRLGDFEYIEAINGQSGYELATKNKPDLVLLDINLPDISGYEVFQMLKQNDTTKNIPVVAVSANAMESDKEQARSLGFTAYITKPIEFDELNEVLNKMV
ncbi:PAS domain S-box protein [Pseudoalteromonas sp. T1lg65]|uniref:PAS domain-containing hybrid sensor histidine kinase/response regulator n=1 Tax=Pseudoalteromonas sp. T1lg65 TaxID=2077101 RepID=UPI003F7A2C2B